MAGPIKKTRTFSAYIKDIVKFLFIFLFNFATKNVIFLVSHTVRVLISECSFRKIIEKGFFFLIKVGDKLNFKHVRNVLYRLLGLDIV